MLRLIRLVVAEIAVVHRHDGTAADRELHIVFRGWYDIALRVDNLEPDQSHIARAGGDRVSFRAEANRRRDAGGAHLSCARPLVAAFADGFEYARCVRHVPTEMQVVRRRSDLRTRVAVPATGRALRGEFEALLALGSAVQKQLDRGAVRVNQDRNELAFATGPIPVREEVQDGLVGPLTLIEVVRVLGLTETALGRFVFLAVYKCVR